MNPQRLLVIWAPEARSNLRSIDRPVAMEILYCLDRYLASRHGDVKRLQAPFGGFRLRCGDYRLFFDVVSESTVNITQIRHRRDAYR